MLNTLLTYISFNNLIWIDNLYTWQSENDDFYPTNIGWTDLLLCNEHFLKVLDLSSFQRCGNHFNEHFHVITSAL